MYFIAYILTPKLHVIVPKTWILEIDKHWEKFVNNSINRNQKHLCFYSERSGAVVDRDDEIIEPCASFIPDFNLSQKNIFPAEGCYVVNLICYKESFEAAVEVFDRRRKVPPGLYNIRRINEMPIPSLNQNTVNDLATQAEETADRSEYDDSRVNLNVQYDEPSDNETEQSIEEDLVRSENQTESFDSFAIVDPLSEQTIHESNVQERIPVPNQNCDTSVLNLIKLESVPLYEACPSNAIELQNLLEDDEIIDTYDEDITFTIKRKTGYALPIKTDSNGLVKRVNDVVSGNKAYNVVEDGRIYMMGASKIKIPHKVINSIKGWNQQTEKNGPDFDKHVTVALLLVCVSMNDLSNFKVNKDVENLIIDFLKVRVGQSLDRLNEVQKYIKEVCLRKSKEIDTGE